MCLRVLLHIQNEPWSKTNMFSFDPGSGRPKKEEEEEEEEQEQQQQQQQQQQQLAG